VEHKDVPNHSVIVEPSPNLFKPVNLMTDTFPSHSHLKIATYGVFNTYPCGIYNPAFTGMFIWELSKNHIMNEYKICKHHSIKSGVILYGTDAYVFTPISNGDIVLHIKMLFKGTTFKTGGKHADIMKNLRNYIRLKSSNSIIPSIPDIQKDLKTMFGIDEQTFSHDMNTYLTLLHRVYMLNFMLHYKMPLQRKFTPGNRNKATTVSSFARKGWYSYLSNREQKLLESKDICISNLLIPDDLIGGMSRKDDTDFTKIQYDDVMNCNMFRDGSMDTSIFQQKVHAFKYLRMNNKPIIPSVHIQSETSYSMNTTLEMEEVPTIEFLLDQVQKCMMSFEPSFASKKNNSRNKMFWSILETCELKSEYALSSLPSSYERNQVCGHVLHVELEDTSTKAMYLTMLESSKDPTIFYQSQVPALFIYCTVLNNPVWDLGLQFMFAKTNNEKVFTCEMENIETYTTKCVCPCSAIFSKWHGTECLNQLPG